MIAATARNGPQKDVAVVGAGVVGLTLAALLGRAGLRVALIDAQATATFDAAQDYDLRVYAITRASERILEAVGAWAGVRSQRHGCFRQMEVWDQGSGGRIHFDAAVAAEPVLGYIVEQNLLRHALEVQVARMGNVDWHRPASLNTWSQHSGEVALSMGDGHAVTAALVVGADGADSRVRTLAGIGYARREYDHHAIVCNVRTQQPHGETARQRFLNTGPLAFLPLDDPHMCSIVWSTSPPQAERLTGLREEAFCGELTDAFEARLGRVLASGPRAVFPLARARAQRYVAPRVALVGDAAHSIHPLAGQGANLGLLDAACLAQVLIEAHTAGRDAGGRRVLRRYERWRRGENLAMQSAMDGFKLLFGSPRLPLRWLRGLGLNLTDRMGFAKDLIMRRAMGLTGDLPRSALPSP